MRCRGQQGYGFSSLPQPIKRHEALKNDVESRGAGYADIVLATSTKVVFSAPVIIGRDAQSILIILCVHTPYAIIRLIYWLDYAFAARKT